MAILTMFMIVGLILTGSRGAWLSLVSVFVLAIVWRGLRQGWSAFSWRKGTIIMSVLAAIIFLATRPLIVNRGATLLDAGADMSFQMRLQMWQGSWHLFMTNPIFGSGFESFQYLFPTHRPAGLYNLIDYAHSEYLQVMIELGAVGLVLLLALFLMVINRAARIVRFSQTSWKRSLAFGGMIGLGSVMVHGLVDFHWHIPAVAFTAVVIAGMISGISYHGDTKRLRSLDIRWEPEKMWLKGGLLALIVVLFGVIIFRPMTSFAVSDYILSTAESARSVRRSSGR